VYSLKSFWNFIVKLPVLGFGNITKDLSNSFEVSIPSESIVFEITFGLLGLMRAILFTGIVL
jgi:hypothetical protein